MKIKWPTLRVNCGQVGQQDLSYSYSSRDTTFLCSGGVQPEAIPENRGKPKKWKISFLLCQIHALSTSFNTFVVTYGVANFLPKLVHLLLFSMEKTEFLFFQFPIFRAWPHRAWHVDALRMPDPWSDPLMGVTRPRARIRRRARNRRSCSEKCKTETPTQTRFRCSRAQVLPSLAQKTPVLQGDRDTFPRRCVC